MDIVGALMSKSRNIALKVEKCVALKWENWKVCLFALSLSLSFKNKTHMKIIIDGVNLHGRQPFILLF